MSQGEASPLKRLDGFRQRALAVDIRIQDLLTKVGTGDIEVLIGLAEADTELKQISEGLLALALGKEVQDDVKRAAFHELEKVRARRNMIIL